MAQKLILFGPVSLRMAEQMTDKGEFGDQSAAQFKNCL